MGCNFYVLSKNTNTKAKDLYETYKDLYETDKLKDLIKGIILTELKPTFDYLKADAELEYKVDLLEDDIEDKVESFAFSLKYEVFDTLDVEEQQSVHIGKSSMGWLFNFQSQDTEIDGIPLKWHTYTEVKAWLTEYVTNQKKFVIKDEYGKELTVDELFDLIDTKQSDPHNLENPDNFTYCSNVNGYRFSSGDFS